MLKAFLLGSLFALLLSAEDGFKPFFNGKDLTEFNIDTPDVWRVEEGVIIGSSTGLKWNDFLRTRKQYRDFVLKVRFRLKDGVGNSGVQFRSTALPYSHEVRGYQADIGERYWGCLYDESRRNRVLAGPMGNPPAKLDPKGWNEYVITARGDQITLDLNGVRTVEYREVDPTIERNGFIALQVHSGPPTQVEFKDLQIRELN